MPPHAQKDYTTDVTDPEAGPDARTLGVTAEEDYVSAVTDPEDGPPARTLPPEV